jgi:hypothetical protein
MPTESSRSLSGILSDCVLLMAILLTVAAPLARAKSLRQTSFHFPGDGTPNQNQQIGPFCCTGETATLRADDEKIVGYIYFYSWQGQAVNKGDHSFAPDVEILVSGVGDLSKEDSEQVKSSIPFKASELSPGATGTTTAGVLSFKATVQNATRETIGGVTYVDIGSLVVVVDLTLASSTSGRDSRSSNTSFGQPKSGPSGMRTL